MAYTMICPECTFPICLQVDYFQKARYALIKEEVYKKGSKYENYQPDKLIFNPDLTPPLEKIFQAIGVEKRCCRMHLNTMTHFDKLYQPGGEQ